MERHNSEPAPAAELPQPRPQEQVKPIKREILMLVLAAIFGFLGGIGKDLVVKRIEAVGPLELAERAFQESQRLEELRSEALRQANAERNRLEYIAQGATASCSTRYVPIVNWKFAEEAFTAISLTVFNLGTREQSDVQVTLTGIGDIVDAEGYSGIILTDKEGHPVSKISELGSGGILEFRIRRLQPKAIFSLKILCRKALRPPQILLDVRSGDVVGKPIKLEPEFEAVHRAFLDFWLSIHGLMDCSEPTLFAL